MTQSISTTVRVGPEVKDAIRVLAPNAKGAVYYLHPRTVLDGKARGLTLAEIIADFTEPALPNTNVYIDGRLR